MDGNNVPRRSERSNKGVPPTRYGLDNHGPDGAFGEISNEKTLVRNNSNVQPQYANSIISKTSTKQSRRSSVREVEHLKKAIERDAEIHAIEMEKLERKKEFLLRAQQLDDELKQKEDVLSNIGDHDDAISEVNSVQQQRQVNEWVNQIPSPIQSENMDNNPNICRHPPNFESTRHNQLELSAQNDVLIAAYKALQAKESKDLPIFNGESVLEWPNFINEFRRSTKEFSISPNKNLRRLDKALKGEARASVQTLLTSPDNIELIISHLASSFGRREWILEYLVLDLKNLPVMKEENIRQFKVFHSKLFGAVTTIKNMNAQNYLDTPELLSTLEEKLPPTTRNYWIHFKAELLRRREVVNIEALGEWFKYELDAQFAGLSLKDVLKKPTKATVLAIDSSSYRKEKWCHKCDGAVGHYLQDCNEFKKMAIESRRDFVKRNNICFMCLRKGHQTNVCRKKETLPKCSKCKKNHADILHYDSVNGQTTVQNTEPQAATPPIEELRCIQTCDVLVKRAMVVLKGPLKTLTIPAFFDDGSTATMIDADLANELGLEGNVSPITYRWTNEIVRTDAESRIVTVGVSSSNKNAKFHGLRNVRTGKNLALPFQSFNVEEVLKLHPYVHKETLKTVSCVQPLLLIGSNNGGLTVSLKTVLHRLDGLLECKSHLGWTIHGPIYGKQSKSTSISVHICSHQVEDKNLNELIDESYRIENFGIINQTDKLSASDESAMAIMRDTMKKVGDRFEIGHLYKYPGQNFPTEESKKMALKRLYLIERKMDRNDKFADEYTQRVEDYVKKGYAEKLTEEEMKETPNTYYLPHFDAYHANKPGKFRWVMDAKAKAGKCSLNDLLHQGPDFVPPLLAVLWRARMRIIGTNADIAEMFHQVEIRPPDRNSQRFFFRGKDRTRNPDVYRMRVMMFGAISSPSCAQFVKNENAKSYEEEFPGVQHAIEKQHYVDDYVDSFDTVREAATMASNIIQVHKNGGFNLVKWISNSAEFMHSIPEEMRLPDHDKIDKVRMLGIQWNIKDDELVFDLDFKKFDEELLNGERVPTKRQILKFLMSIFDPLGVLSPLVIKLRILFQDMWRLDIEWDDQAPEEIMGKWRIWLAEAKSVQRVQVPRCYFPVIINYSNVQLHTFTDAGDTAYCTVTYIRAEILGHVYVALVQAKSKIAPIKGMTVPRLEMQAAVTGCQIANAIQKELGIQIRKRVFWCDSTIVLGWINTKQKLDSYIGCRVSKILDGSNKNEWFWIPTHLNAADLATKTTNAVELSPKSVWLNGPEFLHLPESEWPDFKSPMFSDKEALMFIKELEPQPEWPDFDSPTFNEEEAVMYIEIVEPLEERIFSIELGDPNDILPDINRFSKYNRLIRATAYVLKMVKNLKLSKKERPKELSINVHDMHEAEILWYKKVQADCYTKELHNLKAKKFVKKSSCIYALSPFINENGIICMRGRIPGINPIILQQNHRFTQLLIQHYHEINLHQGIDTVINHLREKFWIPRCRTVVRIAFKLCMMCKVNKPKVRLVEMGDIPEERSEKCEFPFTFTGIDHFGPMMVKYGRRYEKVWGALFTCLTTRGIHVELVSSVDTSSTIMALTRFMNIRGVPSKVFSDNGFVGVDNELSKFIAELDHEIIQNKMSIRGVEWKFNCPAAPNRGGAWERMVRCVKEGLKTLIDAQFPSFEVLSTALSEVMNTVNNRPLTYIPSDADDCNIKSICPNDIILLRANHSQYDIKMEYNFRPREAWKLAHKLADEFWYRWVKEYRMSLIKRAKWPDNRHDPQLKEGDLVRVVDENEIRGSFPKGIIQKVFPDKKGIVRTVKVDIMRGDVKRTYTRPITKIAKIDLSEGLEDVDVENTGA